MRCRVRLGLPFLATGAALALAACGGSNKQSSVTIDEVMRPPRASARHRAHRRPARRPRILSPRRRYFNPNYRLHRPYHRYRYAGYTYNDEIGEDIVGARTPFSQVIAAFGPPRPVPPVDRHDRHGRRCIYYGVISPHGEVSTSEWQFCFRRSGTMYSAVDGEPRDHRPSSG